MTAAQVQLFKPLDVATEAALRASIERFGVLVPIAKARCPHDSDLHGQVLDGHHRRRLALEVGVKVTEIWVDVTDWEQAREIARTLNADRRHLTVKQRREVVVALRELGHSFRAIAGAVGAGTTTVRRDLAGVPCGTPAVSVGRDGKRYPSRRPPLVVVKPSEVGRAQDALAIPAEYAEGAVLDLKRAERVGREQAAEELRAVPVVPLRADDIRIEHADFRTFDPGELVDVVITDPPYPATHLPLWTDLAEWCDRHLSDRGILVAMSGQLHLPDVIARLAERLRYRWCCAYLTAGPNARVRPADVSSGWKPLLIFDRAGSARDFVTGDVFASDGDDKHHHPWGQNAAGFARIVERLTKPGQLVADPFLGGGTTAVACRDLGRRFVGCDIDAAAVHAAITRMEQQ